MNFFLRYSNFYIGPFIVDKYTAPGVCYVKCVRVCVCARARARVCVCVCVCVCAHACA